MLDEGQVAALPALLVVEVPGRARDGLGEDQDVLDDRREPLVRRAVLEVGLEDLGLRLEGPHGVVLALVARKLFPTQGAAEADTKDRLRGLPGGGEVVIHRPTGEIRDLDTINRSDHFPPRDTKH